MAKNVKGSLKVAADMLNGLSKDERDRILNLMKEKNSELTGLIKDELFQFEHLTLMTPAMMRDFLKVVSLKELGLALKLEDQRVIHYFYKSMSSRMAEELRDYVENFKVPKSQALEAHSSVKDKAVEMVESGVLVLNDEDVV